jgi:hypothetical protein
MAQKEGAILSPRMSRGAYIRAETKSAKCATIYSNTT